MAGKGPGPAIEWSSRLAITLVRGLPGTRKLHRLTLQSLGLTKRGRTVFRPNTPSICGMINQVKRHLAVETMEMYNARKQQLAEFRALRPPIVFRHPLPPKPEKQVKMAEDSSEKIPEGKSSQI